MKNYQTPKFTVIEFNHNEDVVTASGTASVTTYTDTVDTYTSWTDLFGGGAQ